MTFVPYIDGLPNHSHFIGIKCRLSEPFVPDLIAFENLRALPSDLD